MSQLSKRLEARHTNMIALGGSIGTGIFLASGYAIFVGGPGGALFAYIVMAVIVYFLMTSLAEMSAYKPSTGSFCDYSKMYVGESFGFAMGYNYWISWATNIAAEISASALVLSYWFPGMNSVIFSAVIFLVILLVNLFAVRIYGEVEYLLSITKVATIIAFLIIGIISIFHQPHLGAGNWSIHGAPFHNGWFGFVSVFLFVGMAFQGTELVAVASGETKNPETTIPRSIGMVFWRLSIFYVLSIALISLLMPYNDPRLLSQNNVAMSPFTLAFEQYLGKYAGDIINLIIFIALVSAANASMYSSARIMWFLAKSKQAPKKLSVINKYGVPINALWFTAAVGALVFVSSLVGNGLFFNYIIQISSLSGFIVWFGIALSHYKFRKEYLPKIGGQAILNYKAKFYPFAQIISLVIVSLVILGQFMTINAAGRSVMNILVTYASVIFVGLIYLGHKIYSLKINRALQGCVSVTSSIEVCDEP